MDIDQHKIFKKYNLITEGSKRTFQDGEEVSVLSNRGDIPSKYRGKDGVIVGYETYSMSSLYSVKLSDGTIKKFRAVQLKSKDTGIQDKKNAAKRKSHDKAISGIKKMMFDSTHPMFADAKKFGDNFMSNHPEYGNDMNLVFFLPVPAEDVKRWIGYSPTHAGYLLQQYRPTLHPGNIEYLLIYERVAENGDISTSYIGLQTTIMTISGFLEDNARDMLKDSPYIADKISSLPSLYFTSLTYTSSTDKKYLERVITDVLGVLILVKSTSLRPGVNNLHLGLSKLTMHLDDNMKLHLDSEPAYIESNVYAQNHPIIIKIYANHGVIGRNEDPAYILQSHSSMELSFLQNNAPYSRSSINAMIIHNDGSVTVECKKHGLNILSYPIDVLKFIMEILHKYTPKNFDKVKEIQVGTYNRLDESIIVDIKKVLQRIAFLTAQSQEDPDIANLFDL